MAFSSWPGIERAPREFLEKLDAEARARGWNADDLAGLISHESRFDPTARNKTSSAAGLIQFTDATARRLTGLSASAIAELSHLEQLPAIVKYFDVGARPLKGSDFLVLGYSHRPQLLGQPDPTIVYAAGTQAAKANTNVAEPDGSITLGSIRREWERWAAPHQGRPFDLTRAQTRGKSSSGAALAVVAGAGILLAAHLRRKRTTR